MKNLIKELNREFGGVEISLADLDSKLEARGLSDLFDIGTLESQLEAGESFCVSKDNGDADADWVEINYSLIKLHTGGYTNNPWLGGTILKIKSFELI